MAALAATERLVLPIALARGRARHNLAARPLGWLRGRGAFPPSLLRLLARNLIQRRENGDAFDMLRS